MIETENLSKNFPVLKGYRDIFLHPFRKKEIRALRNVSIAVNEGEIFGLLGPNGAGKTTLIKILCTLVLPGSGRAFVNGLNVAKDEKRIRKVIGYVISDERSFYWRLTGRQNLKFFAKLNNISGREGDRRIEKLLAFLELSRDGDRMFKDYSTGMRQKLAIARGLLTDPAILFMDEPTNGLDPVSAHNLKMLVKEKLVSAEKKTVIFATHNLQDAEELCHRITIIHDGEVRFTGMMEDFREKFNESKRYAMTLERADEGVLAKIQETARVTMVRPGPQGLSGSVTVEVEIGPRNAGIDSIVREVVAAGGKLSSLNEIKPSLAELFSRTVSTK